MPSALETMVKILKLERDQGAKKHSSGWRLGRVLQIVGAPGAAGG